MKKIMMILGVVLSVFVVKATETVTMLEFPNKINSDGSFAVEVEYSAEQERRLNLVIFNDQWGYLVDQFVNVTGNGKAKLEVKVPNVDASKKYWVNVFFSEKDNAWGKKYSNDNIKMLAVSTVSVSSEKIPLAEGEKESLNVTKCPSDIANNELYEMSANFHTAESRTIIMALFDENWQYIVGDEVNVDGKGTITIGLKSDKIVAGKKYWVNLLLTKNDDKWNNIIKGNPNQITGK